MSPVKRIVLFYDLMFANLGGALSQNKSCKSLRINKLRSPWFVLRVLIGSRVGSQLSKGDQSVM